MRENINFISIQTQQKIRLNRYAKSAMVVMFTTLAIVLVMYCVSIPAIISLKLKNTNSDKKIAAIKTQIDQNKQLESMLQTTKTRSVLTAGLLNTNKQLISRYLDLVIYLSENGYRLKSNLDVKQWDKIAVDRDVPNTLALATTSVFMDDLISQDYITSYHVDAIQRKTDGSYSITIILN